MYATQAKVQTFLGRLLTVTATSVPSASDVADFLTQRSQEIDSALSSRGIVTPVTSPQWFLDELIGLNAKGAAADVFRAALITGEGNDRSSAGPSLLKEYTDRLNQLRLGTGVPVGVAVSETDLAVRSNATGPNARRTEPMFRRERRCC